ncbi:MAG: DUF896 domain-containing protein [Clostridia bacterium]|nr:DUF896 domain-containing protein [Clostridia bacterium]MBQ3639768.1 DUF896 domain-containing protein [Clostridia bacterium]
MEKEKQLRINALAKKQHEEGLTPAEAVEQKQLREEYLAEFRARLKNELDHTVIQDPDGKRTPLPEYRKK